MRIRTALGAALVSLAAVIALVTTGPGGEEHEAAGEPLVIIAVDPGATSATDRLAVHPPAPPWECALDRHPPAAGLS